MPGKRRILLHRLFVSNLRGENWTDTYICRSACHTDLQIHSDFVCHKDGTDLTCLSIQTGFYHWTAGGNHSTLLYGQDKESRLPEQRNHLSVQLLSAIVQIGEINLRERENMWIWFALGSAVFAALTSILAKIGIENVNSNLATAIRTVVVVLMAWGMVFLTHTQNGIGQISTKSWMFLILSGIATGASWLCYYRALQLGEASKVVPIDKLSVVITLILAFVFLHEQFTLRSFVGCILIGAGTLLMVL